MVKYPDEAYTPVMDYYKNLPENLKQEAGEILTSFKKKYKEGEVPPEDMLDSLKALVSRREGGLESKLIAQEKGNTSTKATIQSTSRLKYAAGLALILAGVAALASGVPYMPPPAY